MPVTVDPQGVFGGSVQYSSDGYSLFVAMTMAGLDGLLPVSPQLVCGQTMSQGQVVGEPRFYH